MQPPLKGFIERVVNHIISFDIDKSINTYFRITIGKFLIFNIFVEMYFQAGNKICILKDLFLKAIDLRGDEKRAQSSNLS